MKNKFSTRLSSQNGCMFQSGRRSIVPSARRCKIFFILFFIFSCFGEGPCGNLFAQGPGTWTQKAKLYWGNYTQHMGTAYAAGFSIGTKGYIGTGRGQTFFSYITHKDFWEWNQATDVWTQKADFGGGKRYSAVGFSIGNKGYIGTGADNSFVPQNDFWEWDQATNTWTQKANFPVSAGRKEAIGFSIGAKGYIGTGDDGTGNTTGIVHSDFWEWDQATNTWAQKAKFGGSARNNAVGFSMGTKGYVGTGWDGAANKNDFWEWDQATDTWTQKANFGGTVRQGATGFSIATKGYIGTGGQYAPSWTNLTDFWEWDQATGTWTQKASYPNPHYGPETVGFSIGCHGYIGSANDPKGGDFSDFQEYTPDPLPPNCCFVSAIISANADTICMGSSASILASGGIGYLWSTGATTASIIVAPSITTSYWVLVSDTTGNGCSDMAAVTIPVKNCCSVTPAISSDPAPNTTFCVGQNVYLAASGGTSYAWSTGDTGANIAATLSVTTMYSVIVTDAAGCTGTAAITFIVDPNCTTTGISQLYGSTLQAGIWPNPSAGEFWLSIPSGQFSLSPSTGGEGHSEVEIYNVMGEKVYTSVLTPLSGGRGDGREVIDLSSQPGGVYFLTIKTDLRNVTRKIIIQK